GQGIDVGSKEDGGAVPVVQEADDTPAYLVRLITEGLESPRDLGGGLLLRHREPGVLADVAVELRLPLIYPVSSFARVGHSSRSTHVSGAKSKKRACAAWTGGDRDEPFHGAGRSSREHAVSSATTPCSRARNAPQRSSGGLDGFDDCRVHALRRLVGGGDGDVVESLVGEERPVFGVRQRPGDASDPRPALGAFLGRDTVLGDDIADPDPPAGLEYSRHLCDDGRLVGGEVDHTVGDDHVDRTFLEGDLLDVALEELDVVCSGFGRVLASQ